MGNNEIRVLKALSDRDLTFELKHVNIDIKPPSAALSYTWGEPEFPYVMKVEGWTFKITENLHNALRQVTSHWAQNQLLSSGRHLGLTRSA